MVTTPDRAVAIKAPMRRAPNVAGTSTILARDDREVDARGCSM